MKKLLWIHITTLTILLALLVVGCDGQPATLGGSGQVLNSSAPGQGSDAPGKERNSAEGGLNTAAAGENPSGAPGSNPPPAAGTPAAPGSDPAPADVGQAANAPGTGNGNPPPTGGAPNGSPGGPAGTPPAPGSEPGMAGLQPGSQGTPGAEGQLPPVIQLALGTLKLEGTELAVMTTQAATLLPLWQTAFSLSQADTLDQTALQAAIEAIQSAMTTAQMEAIQSMQWTREDLSALAETLGIEIPAGPQGTPSPEQLATMQASGQGVSPLGGTPGAGGPGGGPGGGAGGPPPGGQPGGAGNNNQPGPPLGGGKFNAAFYQAIIDWLTQKIQ